MPRGRLIACGLVSIVLAASCNGKPESGSPPPSSSTRPLADPVIAAAGDIACQPDSQAFKAGRGTSEGCRAAATAELISKGNYTAVLALGDLQYEKPTLDDFRRSYALSWGKFKAITYPVPGNHEYGSRAASGYYQYWGSRAGDPRKGYYSFDLGAWHLIALNANCGAVGGCGRYSPQGQWLRKDLASHPAGCTLAFWHQPRFSSGLHGNDDVYAEFWRLLYAGAADIVLVAHDHNYERFAPQNPDGRADPKRGMREFVVGTGGRSQYPVGFARDNSEVRHSGTFGVLALTLHARSYEWRFVPISGGTFKDSGSARCH
jgi:hypothetical protein